MPGERSEATTLAPSRAHAIAKFPSPAATSSTSWPADTAQASRERLGGRAERLGQLGVVAEPPHPAIAFLDGVHVHAREPIVRMARREGLRQERLRGAGAARAGRRRGDGPVKGERLAQAQDIPLKFLENILIDLRHAGIVRSQRGADGGYWLAREPGPDLRSAR